MSNTYQLAYYSTATKQFSEDDLLDLLKQARAFNKRHGISGILIYNKGCFLQLLEGENQEVDSLFDHIVEDSRHENSTIIYRKFADERIFKHDWYMAYRNVEEYSDSVRQYLEDNVYNWENGETLENKDNLEALLKMAAREF